MCDTVWSNSEDCHGVLASQRPSNHLSAQLAQAVQEDPDCWGVQLI